MGNAVELFEALFAPTDLVEIRLLRSGRSEFIQAQNLPKVLDVIKQANKDGQDVYFGPNPRRSVGGRKATDVLLARCLWVDVDNCANLRRVLDAVDEARLPAPTAIVFSGGGYHVYWRLAEPIADSREWSQFQRGVIAAIRDAGLNEVDEAIHDPPRIMRLPDTQNHKRGVLSGVVQVHPGREYDLIEFPKAELRAFEVVASEAIPTIDLEAANLSRKTLAALNGDVPEGSRNSTFIAAAMDLAGSGVDRSQAESALLAGADRCGLPRHEVAGIVERAYAKPRSPSKPQEITDKDLEEMFLGKVEAVGGSIPPVAPGGDKPKGEGIAQIVVEAASIGDYDTAKPIKQERAAIANVRVGTYVDGEGNRKKGYYYVSIREIAERLRASTGGWPRVCGTSLFVLHEQGGKIRARYLANKDELFAWMAECVPIRWFEGTVLADDKSELTPPTKAEFFRHLVESSPNRYVWISELPHFPPIPGYFYLPVELPTSTGEHLETLVSRFNAATRKDRDLMEAALLTLFRGGAPGTRPGFLFDADSPGSGKSATVEVITKIAGGAHMCNDPEQKWTDTTKEMMSSENMNARAIVFDNVRRIVEGQAIESAITATRLSGWRIYHGLLSRPNDVTVFITANGAHASSDMSSRVVTIKIGAPIKGFDFVSWAGDYVERYRMNIIADILAKLQSESKVEAKDLAGDRWASWQVDVLSKFEAAKDLSSLILERREAIDNDATQGVEIAEILFHHAEKNGAISEYEIDNFELWRLLVETGFWDPKGKHVPDPIQLRNIVRHVLRLTGRLGVASVAMTSSGKNPKRVEVEVGDRTIKVGVLRFDVAKMRGSIAQDADLDDIPY